MTLALLYKTDITEQDLLDLIGTVSERLHIDFKHDAYIGDPKKGTWQEALCKDVSAFANAEGGIIICGIGEKNGYADNLCGLGGINPDAEIRRLKQVISSNISPVISGIQIVDIKLSDPEKGFAIVIKIPRSVYQPHRSEITKLFTIRRSNGNEDMSMEEVRNAFNLSTTFVERAKDFRKERVHFLMNSQTDEIPVIIPREPSLRVVLHLIPLSSLMLGKYLNLAGFTNSSKVFQWLFKGNLNYNTILSTGKFNINGFCYSGVKQHHEREFNYYNQLYRTGMVESVWWLVDDAPREVISLRGMEMLSIDLIKDIITLQANLGIEMPLIIMMSIVNGKGYKLPYKHLHGDSVRVSDGELSSNQLLVPEIVIEQLPKDEDDLRTALRPLFNMVANIANLPESPSYDTNGKWINRGY